MDIVNDANSVALEDMDIETLREEVCNKIQLLPDEDIKRAIATYMAKQHLRSLIMELTDEECDRLFEEWVAQHP